MRIWGKIIKDNHLIRDTEVLLEGPDAVKCLNWPYRHRSSRP